MQITILNWTMPQFPEIVGLCLGAHLRFGCLESIVALDAVLGELVDIVRLVRGGWACHRDFSVVVSVPFAVLGCFWLSLE